MNLKVIPWNYGGGLNGATNCKEVLLKNNPLCLLKRVIKPTKKLAEKVSEENAVEFLKKMTHNEVEIVRKLEEVLA